MAIEKVNGHVLNGNALPKTEIPVAMVPQTPMLDEREPLLGPDPSRLKVTLCRSNELKSIPAPEDLVFGATTTDHMLLCSYSPTTGWSDPEIKPYSPLTLDPASSCFQYCPNIFEGMKAYLSPSGEPLLFRPKRNMERLERSAARVALPPFNGGKVLELLKKLVAIDKRWVPTVRGSGYSLYLRPTIIGTRPSLGVVASDSCMLYIILCPTGPFFKSSPDFQGIKPVSLLAVGESVRSWPGGTGGHKLGLNYAPTFLPGRIASQRGYDQVLWLLKDEKTNEMKITEAGAMNFFVAVKRDDPPGALILTPPLDGTILPGVTRDSVINLIQSHGTGKGCLPGLDADFQLTVEERSFTLSELIAWTKDGTLLEAWGVGTAVVVAPVGRIGFETVPKGAGDAGVHHDADLKLPEYEGGIGPVGKALRERLMAIQEGDFEWQGWSVKCTD